MQKQIDKFILLYKFKMSKITIEELEQLANEVQGNMDKVLSVVIGESGCEELMSNKISESECIKLFNSIGSAVYDKEQLTNFLVEYDTAIKIIVQFDSMSESQNVNSQDEQYDPNSFFGKKRVSKKLKMLM